MTAGPSVSEKPAAVEQIPEALPAVGGSLSPECAVSPAVPPEQPRFNMRAKVRSLFVLSVGIFGLLNIYCSFSNPFHFDPFKYSYKGWAWWTMNDLKDTKVEHNVAMLGSSLMVSAVAGLDANYLNKPLDLTKYHKVSYLDDNLEKIFPNGSFNTFNLSAPGQMPSDAYLILRAMVSKAVRPDVVIYGVAPRDFVDSELNGPNDTEPFKYLTRFINIDEVMTHEFRSSWSRLDWLLGRVVFMYGYGLDFKLALQDLQTKLMDKWFPAPPTNKPFTFWDRQKLLPQYFPAEIHPNAMMATPLKADAVDFKDNTAEYKRRYKTPDPETFHTQMYFLRKLAEFCKRERIRLVMVNMPIMKCNVEMLPHETHQKYLHSLREFAWNNDVVYYDLCRFEKYSQSDYHDTVHMNAFGAQKFFDDLLALLKKDLRASTALRLAGVQLKDNTELAEKMKDPRARMY